MKKANNRYVFDFVSILEQTICDTYIANDIFLEKYVVHNGFFVNYSETYNNATKHVDISDVEEWINGVSYDYACSKLGKRGDEETLQDNFQKAQKIMLILGDNQEDEK